MQVLSYFKYFNYHLIFEKPNHQQKMSFTINEPDDPQYVFQNVKINIKMQFILLKMIYAFYKPITLHLFNPSYL
jgi:hypothetical protein